MLRSRCITFYTNYSFLLNCQIKFKALQFYALSAHLAFGSIIYSLSCLENKTIEVLIMHKFLTILVLIGIAYSGYKIIKALIKLYQDKY